MSVMLSKKNYFVNKRVKMALDRSPETKVVIV